MIKLIWVQPREKLGQHEEHTDNLDLACIIKMDKKIMRSSVDYTISKWILIFKKQKRLIAVYERKQKQVFLHFGISINTR